MRIRSHKLTNLQVRSHLGKFLSTKSCVGCTGVSDCYQLLKLLTFMDDSV